jgi:predicted transcriptional regulator
MQPYRSVGEIKITNTLSTREDCLAEAVAMELLSTSFQALPVLDDSGKVIGKVTEMNLLNALKAGKNLRSTRVKEIMAPAPPVVNEETPLEEAIDLIDANRLMQLSVIKRGRFIGSITRHDLLRAWLGIWVEHERGSFTETIG